MFYYKSLIPLLGSLLASMQISFFAESNFMDHILLKSLDLMKTNTNFRTWAGSDSFPLGKCCFIERYKLFKKKKKKLQRGKKEAAPSREFRVSISHPSGRACCSTTGGWKGRSQPEEMWLFLLRIKVRENQSMFVMDLRLALDALCPGETTELSFSMDQLDTDLIFTESCQDRRDRGA